MHVRSDISCIFRHLPMQDYNRVLLDTLFISPNCNDFVRDKLELANMVKGA